MTLPRYPAYKDSGVEWLGEVPEHWMARPLRSLAKSGRNTFIDGDWIESPYITDDGVRLIQTGNVGIGVYREQGFRFISDETFADLGCTEVEPNDVLICRLAAPVGRACLAPGLGCRMITSVDVCILKPRQDVSEKFVVYFASSSPYLAYLESQCRGGTRDRVSRSFLGTVPVFLPSYEEQQRIVAFLNHETAKIDNLIAEQQSLIALLKEKRQAVISHAVTKGLNPDVPMKDSGVEWLGEVPEHWRFGSLSRFATRVVVGIAEAATHAYSDIGIPILRSTNVKEGKIVGEILRIKEEFAQGLGSKRIRSGDLVTVRTGNAGVTAVVPDELDGCQCFTMLITSMREGFDAHYISYFVNSEKAQRYFSIEGWGTAQVNISVPILKSLPVSVPPLKEQIDIVEFLNHQTKIVDALTSAAEQTIQLLNERRSALISAAVTGKIDVRDRIASEAA